MAAKQAVTMVHLWYSCRNDRHSVKTILETLFRPAILTAVLSILCLIGIAVVAMNHQTADSGAKPSAGIHQPSMASVPVATKDLTDKTGNTDAPALVPLGKQVAAYLSQHSPKSSVYLESLSKQNAVIVGDTGQHNTKSLMKLPLVMSLYKADELGLLQLSKTIELTSDEIDRDYGDLWKKGAGHKLTLQEAAKLALQDSDNTAMNAINDHVNAAMPRSERAYNAMDLDMRVEHGDAFMTTEAYATVFRCLHASCYNDKQDSKQILELMEHTSFTAPNGLIPARTRITHKIGSVNTEGYNDCGIVYGPKVPFIFCLMLTSTQPQADMDIAQIIKLGYDFFEK